MLFSVADLRFLKGRGVIIGKNQFLRAVSGSVNWYLLEKIENIVLIGEMAKVSSPPLLGLPLVLNSSVFLI
jgi:hypothetical protein